MPAHIDARAWAGYTWLGIIGVLVACTLWFAGIRRLAVAPTAFLGLLSPLTATLRGVAIAGETLRGVQVPGLALVLLALVSGRLPSKTGAHLRIWRSLHHHVQ